MYKVFIDNWTLILSEDVNISNEEQHLFKRYKKSTELEDLKIKALAQTDSTIRLKIDKPVDLVLKKLFKNYKWVEAAGGLVKQQERYLVIFRQGKWDLPKGKVDKGEKIEAAAIREIEEECGIQGPIITHALIQTYHTYAIYGPPTIKKTYWFALDYSGDEKGNPELEEGITAVEWVDKEKLEEIKNETFPSIALVIDSFLA